MSKAILNVSVLGFFVMLLANSTQASEFHATPFDFLFGNHIDTHQETKLKLSKRGSPKKLFGSLYIIYTGDIDAESGLPIARHPRGASQGEDCNDPAVNCLVGWLIRGLPGETKFLYHSGVNGDDHPVWLINRVDIPQPGSYSHFHWISSDSTDPRADSVPAECDVNMAGQLEGANHEGGAENIVCPGWYLQIRATREFAFQHSGENIPVQPGIDNATHLNLLTNYAEVPGITATRGGAH